MKVALTDEKDLLVFPPAIPFHPKPKKKADDERDKSKFVTLEVPIGRGNTVSTNKDTTEWSFRVFDDGADAEDYVQWRIRLEEVVEAMYLDTPEKKYAVIQTTLRGEARTRFASGWNSVEIPSTAAATKVKELQEKRLLKGFNALAKPLFVPVESAWRRQRSYLRYHVKFGNMTVAEFKRRLVEHNDFLRYFPPPPGKRSVSQLTEEELVEIIDRAKPVEYHCDVLANNYDPYQKTLQEYTEYLERLETKHGIQKAMARRNNQQGRQGDDDDNGGGKKSKNNKNKNKGAGKRKNNGGGDSGNLKCGHCGGANHRTEDCWDDDRNERKRPAGWKPRNNNKRQRRNNNNSRNNDYPRLSAEQMNFLMQGFEAFKKNSEGKKRKIELDDENDDDAPHTHFLLQMNRKVDPDSDNNNSDYDSDAYTNDYNKNYVFVGSEMNKKRKIDQLSTEVVGQIVDVRGEIVPLRVLLDTGSTSTIVLRKFAKKLNPLTTKTVRWNTMAGQFATRRTAPIKVKLPEFSTSKTIAWTAHVDETTDPKKAMFDLIIGIDLMEALGVDISFKENKITWDDVTIPMKERGLVSDHDSMEIIFHTAVQAPIITKAETRQRMILDADYSQVDIDETIDQLEELSNDIKDKLKNVLKKTPNAFKGGLGTLKIKPIHLQLKPNAQPYHGKAFPIPKAYERTTRKEAKRFEEIGVWYHNPDTAWAAPTFIQPKKTGDVRILTDLRELNKWIVRKPYPLPKIQDMLQKLEQFSYATALDLSMGYYHIPLDKESQELCTTILPWGKYSYAKLPMGLCNAPDIFQAIMNELLGDLPYVLVYLDDILILNNKRSRKTTI